MCGTPHPSPSGAELLKGALGKGRDLLFPKCPKVDHAHALTPTPGGCVGYPSRSNALKTGAVLERSPTKAPLHTIQGLGEQSTVATPHICRALADSWRCKMHPNPIKIGPWNVCLSITGEAVWTRVCTFLGPDMARYQSVSPKAGEKDCSRAPRRCFSRWAMVTGRDTWYCGGSCLPTHYFLDAPAPQSLPSGDGQRHAKGLQMCS